MNNITAIAIKFFGIYLLVNMIIWIPSISAPMVIVANYTGVELDLPRFLTFFGSVMVVGIFISVMLFRLSKSIAANVQDLPSSSIEINQELLLQILGVYFIVAGFSGLPDTVVAFFNADPQTTLILYLAVGDFFQVFLGLYFVVKPVVWAQWLNKLRGRS